MICPEINMKSGTIALSLVLVVLTYDVTLSQANGDSKQIQLCTITYVYLICIEALQSDHYCLF